MIPLSGRPPLEVLICPTRHRSELTDGRFTQLHQKTCHLERLLEHGVWNGCLLDCTLTLAIYSPCLDEGLESLVLFSYTNYQSSILTLAAMSSSSRPLFRSLSRKSTSLTKDKNKSFSSRGENEQGNYRRGSVTEVEEGRSSSPDSLKVSLSLCGDASCL